MHVTTPRPSSTGLPLRLPGLALLAALFVGWLFFAAPLARAQAPAAAWSPAGGKLPVGLLNDITLVIENCQPKGDPQPPAVPGLTLVLRGRSQNISISGFKKSVSVQYSFAVRLEKKQSVTVPAFTVETDQGPVTVAAIHFDPGEATIGGSQLSIEDVANSKFVLPQGPLWAGEVFYLNYRLDALRRYFHQLASNPDWDPNPFVVEEWEKPELQESTSGSDPTLSIRYRTRAYAKNPGLIQLNGAQQLVNIRTGNTTGFFGTQPELQQLSIASNQPRITVKPLPTPAPASFNGAVGAFALKSKVVPQKAKAGEPITWTLELSGTGNWPSISGLPARSVPKAFEVVQPQAKKNTPEGKLFEATLTEDVIMIPKEPGTYTIPAMAWSYFDPQSGSYRTLNIPKTDIVIEAAGSGDNANASNASQGNKGGGNPLFQERADGPLPNAPKSPDALPGSALQSTGRVTRPLSEQACLTLACIPLASVLVAWGLLAFFRALERDPQAKARQARSRLQTLLGKTMKGPNQDLRHTVNDWRLLSAQALNIAKSAPSAQDLSKALSTNNSEALREEWSRLWNEAEAFLYGADTKLPGDWVSRASGAAKTLRIPRFNPLSILRPSNQLPWLFALAVLLGCALGGNRVEAATPAMTPQENATELYQKGDFAGATRLWQEQAAKAPTDWAARHNLGIALLQQGHHGAAVAELTAALVQNPSNEAVRRDFRVAATAAGYTPEPAGALASEGPVNVLTRQLQPLHWQYLVALSMTAIALALITYLLFGHGRARRVPAWAAHLLFCLGVLLAIASLLSLHRYGPLADPSAAVVWQSSTLRSIPIELDASQKSSAIPAGTVCVVGKSYLGWCQIRIGQEDLGWVRHEDLVMIWR